MTPKPGLEHRPLDPLGHRASQNNRLFVPCSQVLLWLQLQNGSYTVAILDVNAREQPKDGISSRGYSIPLHELISIAKHCRKNYLSHLSPTLLTLDQRRQRPSLLFLWLQIKGGKTRPSLTLVKDSTPLTLVKDGTKVLPNLTLNWSKVLLIAVKAVTNFDVRQMLVTGDIKGVVYLWPLCQS